MGLSQGCAASIVAMLLWKGERIGALVGMCGYVPFRKGMYESVEDVNSHDTDSLVDQEDIFERDDEESGSGSKFEKAVDWLREELGICNPYQSLWDMEEMMKRSHVILAN
jgi:hypothetical protein